MSKVLRILKWVAIVMGLSCLLLVLIDPQDVIETTAGATLGCFFLLVAIFCQLEERGRLVERIEKPSGPASPRRQRAAPHTCINVVVLGTILICRSHFAQNTIKSN